MTASKLERMAAEMRAMLTDTSARWVHRRLSRGLELVLQRTDERWRLALARAETWPSNEEIAVCKAAFQVPDPVDEEYKMGSHRRSLYVVEMFWRELATDGMRGGDGGG